MGFDSKMQELATLNEGLLDSVARKNIVSLFDANTFVEIDALVASGVVCGYGYIDGSLCYAYAQDGDSINTSNATKIKRIYDLAVKNGSPIIAMYDSIGAKVTQGNEMLKAYGEILMSANNLSGVVPIISVVLGTCAGVSSLIATSADFVIMNEKAELFLTAPFTAKANKKGNDDSASAKNMAAYGLASVVCPDTDASIEMAKKIVSLLPSNNLSIAPLFESESANVTADLNAIAADLDNNCACKIVSAIVDNESLIELNSEYAPGMFTALATLQGSVVGVVATNKVKGELTAEACNKAAKLIKTCDAFNIPVITLIDTVGFELSACPCLMKNAKLLANAYAEATTQKINVIIGNAIGAAYITLAGTNANADLTFCWPTAIISALPSVTAVEFLYADKFIGTTDASATREELVEEYNNTEASPFTAASGGYVNSVIEPSSTRNVLINSLDMLAGKRVSKLPKKHNTIV